MRKSKANYWWVVSFLILLIIGGLDFCTQAASSEKNLVLPELYYNNKTSYLQLLDLNDGKIKRMPIVPNIFKETVERVIELGNQSVALICRDDSIGTHCGDHEGYVYIYNTGTKKLTELDFRANDSDNIEIDKSKNGLYFGIDYVRHIQDLEGLENETMIFQTNPLRLQGRWVSNDKGWFYDIDDEFVYYRNKKNDVSICSLADGKEIKQIKLTDKPISINNGKALVKTNDKYELIDLKTLKSQQLMLDNIGIPALSKDNKWVIQPVYKSSKYTGDVVFVKLQKAQKKTVTIDPNILNYHMELLNDAMIVRNDYTYFIGKKTMVSVDLATGKTKTLPLTYVTAAQTSQSSIKPSKADEAKIRTLLANYERSLVEAINSNNFSLVASLLQPGSSLYRSQQKLVADLYRKKVQEKLVKYNVAEIKTIKAGIFQVKVTEQIGVKTAGKSDFAVKEFNWVYTVVKTGKQYRLSELGK